MLYEESPILTPEAVFTEEPTQEPIEIEEPSRSVYDGSISDSYLRQLSAYYNMHARLGTPYCITRPSQYVYQLVYGTSSDGINFTDAHIIRITVGTYNQNSTISVTNGATISVDVSGSTAYVYSSNPQYLPSSYISDSPRLISFGIFALVALFALSCLVRFIWSLIKR